MIAQSAWIQSPLQPQLGAVLCAVRTCIEHALAFGVIPASLPIGMLPVRFVGLHGYDQWMIIDGRGLGLLLPLGVHSVGFAGVLLLDKSMAAQVNI